MTDTALLPAHLLTALRRLAIGPVRRDGEPDPIAFEVATGLLAHGLIEPGTETSRGLAIQRWRVWKITEKGIGHLVRMEAGHE